MEQEALSFARVGAWAGRGRGSPGGDRGGRALALRADARRHLAAAAASGRRGCQIALAIAYRSAGATAAGRGRGRRRCWTWRRRWAAARVTGDDANSLTTYCCKQTLAMRQTIMKEQCSNLRFQPSFGKYKFENTKDSNLYNFHSGFNSSQWCKALETLPIHKVTVFVVNSSASWRHHNLSSILNINSSTFSAKTKKKEVIKTGKKKTFIDLNISKAHTDISFTFKKKVFVENVLCVLIFVKNVTLYLLLQICIK
ncbi:Protein of unknown function [Gryllus bimaculatus]|nr:Protein of unknown function [Gryllus bimaculatus]